MIVAPLKRECLQPSAPPRLHFHDHMIVAPLKLRADPRRRAATVKHFHDHMIVEIAGKLITSIKDIMLQWGHDHMIVEISAWPMRTPLDLSLQWGHDHMIVEIHQLAELIPKLVSFNGATII
jgi:hypothetical protein